MECETCRNCYILWSGLKELQTASTENSECKRVVTATAAKDSTLLVPAVLRKIVGVEPYDMFVVKIVSQADDEFVISFKKLD